ncbi:MAG: hypothetical protein LBS21_09710 [Clostridiales bacterium]|jgi:hypothetical protein|nr:hypothetical protein [Clostridiales bacterium]
MFSELLEKIRELFNGVKDDTTVKKVFKILVIGAVIVVLWNVFKTVTNVIKGNWYMTLGFIFVLCVIANYFQKPTEKEKSKLSTSQLEYNYKMFRTHLFRILSSDLTTALNLVKPKFPIGLDSPVRWGFIGSTAVYHYIMIINDISEAVDTELIKNTIQLKINQALENGRIDGAEASSKLYGDYAMPRIWLDEVTQSKNLLEFDVVFVDKDYAENHRSRQAEETGNSLDIRDITDDEEY